MKQCSKCKKEKDESDFPKKGNICKHCKSEYRKQYYATNKGREAETNKKYRDETNYYERNKDAIKAKSKAYQDKNKDVVRRRKAVYVENNKDAIKQYMKKYHTENREKKREYDINYRKENKERLDQIRKDYCEKNKDRISKQKYEYRRIDKNKKRHNDYLKSKRKIDEGYRISELILRQVKAGLKSKGLTKSKRLKEYGVDTRAIYEHLGERPNNDCHIDHILPVCAFDFTKAEHIYACWYPDNLQWLPSRENISKNGRYSQKDFDLYISKFMKMVK